MGTITLLPSAKVPLIYDGDLTMTTEWYRFFWNIYGFTGTGVVPVDKGGTGLTGIGNHQVIIGNIDGVFEPAELRGFGVSVTYDPGFVNISIGASGVTPGTYGTQSAVGQFTIDQYGVITFAQNVNIGINANQIISGILPIVRGGTGQSTYTDGQLLIGNSTGNTLTKATLTAGTGINITNGAGSVTIANTGVLSVSGTAPVVSSGGANPAISMAAANTTTNGYLTSTDWNTFNNKQPAGSYLTAVSVVSANGFAGTSSGGTTPALTLSTTITGLLKGNGTAISAATSGTDYAPATSGTSILYGNGAGGFSNVTIGSGISFAGGTLSATGSGGTVTSVTGTSPVVSSGGTTPAISLATAYGDTLNPYASKTANYFLAAPNGSAGVPTFRALVAADVPALSYVTSVSGTGTVNGITLTGTVTSSGSLTLGGTLSGIGNSQLTNSTISGVALGGNLFNLTAGTGVSFSAGTTYNGSTAITISATGTGGTVTSVAALTLGTTGTDLSSTVANSTTTPVITLNVPTASATNRGALSAADWSTFNSKQPAGSYLTAVSVVSANGFAGTSSGGLTPALTLSTTITGLLKGNGTAISAAASGTDYAPATSGSSILYGNGAGGFSNVTIGSGLSFTGGTLASTSAGGTVTSVAMTVPSFLSVSGSPITTTGTLAVTLSGTALPVANGGTGLTATPSNGQIDIGNGTGFTRTTLTAGSGISVTNASGAITIANTQNTGPAFSAYANTTQSITAGTFTKVAFQSEEFDTNANYDSTTNYRFLPTVAGYYQITGGINLVTPSTRCFVMIYKNGALYKTSPDIQSSSVGGQTVTSLIYLNGTDYVEFYAFTGTNTSIYGAAGATPYTWFCGAMIRTS